MLSDTTQRQRGFWALFAETLPELSARMVRGNESTRWLVVGHRPLVAAHFYSNNAAGIFVRGARGTRIGHIREDLFPHREFFAKALGQPDLKLGTNFLLATRFRADMNERANWPAAITWFKQQSPRYEKMLTALQRR